MIGDTRIDLFVMAILGAASAAGLFAILSAFITAVLFGPRERPFFVQRNAWMFTRPEGAVEWFGLGVAIWIALMFVLMPFGMTTPLGGADFGVVGRLTWYTAYPLMVIWLVYLWRIYRAHRTRD